MGAEERLEGKENTYDDDTNGFLPRRTKINSSFPT